MIDFTELGYNSTEIPYRLSEEDLEFALMIRNNFKVRDLVRVWFEDEDGRQYAIKGGIHAMGLQHLYIKGLTEDKYVAEQILPMQTIIDIEPCEDQVSPYEVELQLELAATRWEASQKSSYEERALAMLRAANGDQNAEDSEGRAAGVTAIQETIWDESERTLIESPISIEAQAAQEDFESGYPVTCARCGDPFMNLTAYWNHLDAHDMATLNSGKYSN